MNTPANKKKKTAAGKKPAARKASREQPEAKKASDSSKQTIKKTGGKDSSRGSKSNGKKAIAKKVSPSRRPPAKKASTSRRPKVPNPPEQKLGDTPVLPWAMPTPEEKAQARPLRRALQEAVKKIDSQEKADQVIDHLEIRAAGQTATDVEKAEPPKPTPAAAAQEVIKAAKAAPTSKETEEVLDATARALSTQDKRQREVVSEAAQEVLNPQQQGAALPEPDEQQREYLRQAALKRLKPLDALDANLFLKVNHLPHSRLLNALFYGLTFAYQGGAAWYTLMGIAALRNRRVTGRLVREAALPLLITNLLVELPIKTYFKRRRPFITIIQAIVIGKKPGTYSFPSGHSAAAFAGAWLLNRKSPRWSALRYTVAGLVAFSRVYLGDHYPGDVVSGSSLGMLFAGLFGRLARFRRKK